MHTEAAYCQDVESLRGKYSDIVIDIALRYRHLFWSKGTAWAAALQCPLTSKHQTMLAGNKLVDGSRQNIRLIGIAGPGAVGKDTVMKCFRGFEAAQAYIKRTTTRAPRVCDDGDADYKFISEPQFEQLRKEGCFLVEQFRSGRGNYGIEFSEVEKCMAMRGTIFVQESPNSLYKLMQFCEQVYPSSRTEIFYILPPFPIYPNLVLRYIGRNIEKFENLSQSLIVNIESTLGGRQLEEYSHALRISNCFHKLKFVENDDPTSCALNIISNIV